MAREAIFSRETKLWHPDEPGGWRVFPAGEQDPGPAWSEVEGGGGRPGDRDAKTLQEMRDITARAEKAEQIILQRQRDIDVIAQERDDANAKVAGLERRANEAEKALAEAKADKQRYAEDRDRAIENEARVRRENDALKANIAKMDGDGDGKVGGRKKAAA